MLSSMSGKGFAFVLEAALSLLALASLVLVPFAQDDLSDVMRFKQASDCLHIYAEAGDVALLDHALGELGLNASLYVGDALVYSRGSVHEGVSATRVVMTETGLAEARLVVT